MSEMIANDLKTLKTYQVGDGQVQEVEVDVEMLLQKEKESKSVFRDMLLRWRYYLAIALLAFIPG